jgi:hypothetical protein
MARPFAPTLRPPWIVAACAFAGAGAAWIATSAEVTSLLWHGFREAVVVRSGDLASRLAYCAWIAATHALAAVLYRRRSERETPLGLWTFAASTIVPGVFLSFLFVLFAGDRAIRPSLLVEPTLLGLFPSLLALPVVAAISAADRRPVPARALAMLAAGLLVPWSLGDQHVFAIALASALTLSALALALALAAAGAGDSVARVRCVRGGGESYRSAGRIAFAIVENAPEKRGLSPISAAAALIVAVGVVQIAVLAKGLDHAAGQARDREARRSAVQ